MYPNKNMKPKSQSDHIGTQNEEKPHDLENSHSSIILFNEVLNLIK